MAGTSLDGDWAGAPARASRGDARQYAIAPTSRMVGAASNFSAGNGRDGRRAQPWKTVPSKAVPTAAARCAHDHTNHYRSSGHPLLLTSQSQKTWRVRRHSSDIVAGSCPRCDRGHRIAWHVLLHVLHRFTPPIGARPWSEPPGGSRSALSAFGGLRNRARAGNRVGASSGSARGARGVRSRSALRQQHASTCQGCGTALAIHEALSGLPLGLAS